MAGMMERAKGLLGKNQPSSAPLPFSTRCRCGETIQGVRQRQSQIFICPTCGESVFILPRSPLPEPNLDSVGKGAKAKGKKAKAAKVAASPPREPRVPLGERAKQAGRRVGAALWTLAPPRRWFTRGRMIFAGVTCFVALTVWWQIHQNTLRRLREELMPEARRGLQALSEGKFPEAKQHLEYSVNAMDRLGESFPDEQRHRQAYAELAIVTDLLAQPLEKELEGGKGNEQLKASLLRGRAILLDAEVEPDPAGGWSIGYVTFIDGEPLPLHPAGLALFDELKLDKKTRVIFGARIEDIVQENESWRLKLVHDSGVLMTEQRIFADLGLLRDADTAGIRERQQAIVRGDTPPEPRG